MPVQVSESSEVPDSTYFTTKDADPVIDGNRITMLNGRGTRRSWGSPQVSSKVIANNANLLVVHVGFSHKHGGGQFYRYYRYESGKLCRVTWRNIGNEERKMVINAWIKNAPTWAKSPGILKRN